MVKVIPFRKTPWPYVVSLVFGLVVLAVGTIPGSAIEGSDQAQKPAVTSTTVATLGEESVGTVVTTVGVSVEPEVPQEPPDYGFVRPVKGVTVGHRVEALTDIAGLVNDGASGLTIDDNFLNQHSSAEWITQEADRTVIHSVSAVGVCLNITTTVTLRDSLVSCPTRSQSDRWGYVGRDNHAPAVNILAPDVIIEHSTVTCTGTDDEICSRTVWAGTGSVIRFNDLSGAAGIVELGQDSLVEYNHMHGLAFGADRRQTNANNNGGITHNNVINSLGHTGASVIGNYIEATYGRVSADPDNHRTTQYLNIFDGGIIEVGDPLNGFVFAHYPILGSGEGYVARHNYIESAARAMSCQPSDSATGCAADMSFNAFAKDRFGDFRQQPMFRSTRDNGTFGGRCNFTLDDSLDPTPEVLPGDIFDNGGSHGTADCF